jgi:excisionase family DNA binding protein
MLPKPRRPREKRIVPLMRVAYSIAEFCDVTGLSRATVLRSIDEGALRIIKIGNRRLIVTRQPRTPDSEWNIVGCRPGSDVKGRFASF